MKNDWTVRITLAILMGSLPVAIAGEGASVKKSVVSSKRGKKAKTVSIEACEERIAELEGRLKMLKVELGVLRKTLAGTMNNADKREKTLLRIQCSVAAALAEGKKRVMSDESVKLLESLSKLEKSGKNLVSTSTEFCDFVDNALNKKVLTDLDKARLRFSLEKLKTAAELFYSLAGPEIKTGFFRSCRVLALNDELQLVVLNAGSTSGVRNGLNLRSSGSKNKILLRVVDVRPYVSGAIVVEGDIGVLAPGMEFKPGG
ncbi:MAG: hypothetical protein GXP32_00095 [Kiritimatiellaeota bacterium]|nr:hypothetical protein [Kiritimatiellota bacterium]